LEFAALELKFSRCLKPLYERGFLSLSGKLIFYPEKLRVGSNVILSVDVCLNKELFDYYENLSETLSVPEAREPSGVDRALFELLEILKISHSIEKQALEGVGDEISSDRLSQILSSALNTKQSLNEAEQPKSLKITLRGYQKQALQWMQDRESRLTDSSDLLDPLWQEGKFQNGDKFYASSYLRKLSLSIPKSCSHSRGGILADEMGMGKTIEMLSLICSKPFNCSHGCNLCAKNPCHSTTLIICPMSLLSQWRDEIETHTDLEALVYYGNEREGSLHGRCDILLTTYGVVASEHQSGGPSFLFRHQFERIVLDEVLLCFFVS